MQPASVDLRLGDSFRVFHNHKVAAIDLREGRRLRLTEEVVVTPRGGLRHPPGRVLPRADRGVGGAARRRRGADRGQMLARAAGPDRPRDRRVHRPGLEGDADARAQQPHPRPDQALPGPADRPAVVHGARRAGRRSRTARRTSARTTRARWRPPRAATCGSFPPPCSPRCCCSRRRSTRRPSPPRRRSTSPPRALVAFALILSAVGIRSHETFPPSKAVGRGLMLAVAALLVAGAMFTAVITG